MKELVLKTVDEAVAAGFSHRWATSLWQVSDDRVHRWRARRLAVGTLEQLQAAAPSATIVLVTYPRIVDNSTCDALGLDPSEADVIRTMGERLQEVFVDVAEETGITLVDPYSAGDHTVCVAPEDRWMNGSATSEDGFAYHPNAAGHRAMADLVQEALSN